MVSVAYLVHVTIAMTTMAVAQGNLTEPPNRINMLIHSRKLKSSGSGSKSKKGSGSSSTSKRGSKGGSGKKSSSTSKGGSGKKSSSSSVSGSSSGEGSGSDDYDDFFPPITDEPNYRTTDPTSEPDRQDTPAPSRPPTLEPTRPPTSKPSSLPTSKPTVQRTNRPSRPPTSEPSRRPTEVPTSLSTSEPTLRPTRRSTNRPTPKPSRQKTPKPSGSPTTGPTRQRTKRPTPKPSRQKTPKPSGSPTTEPTRQPTERPTQKPSRQKTPKPSGSPTTGPTRQPTERPTTRPTPEPTLRKTPKPSRRPTQKPSRRPTVLPTQAPTRLRTFKPSPFPTAQVTSRPVQTPRPTPASDQDVRRSTGKTCTGNEQCRSNVCRNGACMASEDCYPVKHEYGTPFDENKINLVFVGSGFDTATHEEWLKQVNTTYEAFSNYEILSNTIKQLNVFVVDPRQLVPSYCIFFCATIERLLCCNTTQAQALSSKCFSDGANLQTIVIENNEDYGGAGYTFQNIATTSIHPDGPEIAVHEIGHSLFELADEYSYGVGTSDFANCAFSSNCSKWADLIGNTPSGYNSVSCVPGCRNGNYFIGESSYMDVLSNPVGAVNTRLTCCTYQALTKEMPEYCKKFDLEENSVFDFCKNNDYQNYGTVNYEVQPSEIRSISTPYSKYTYVTNPLLVKVILWQGRKGRANLSGQPVTGVSGLYRTADVVGDFTSVKNARENDEESVVKVKVFYLGFKQTLYFSRRTVIGVPIVSTAAGETPDAQEPRQVVEAIETLNLALDTQGRTVRKIQVSISGKDNYSLKQSNR